MCLYMYLIHIMKNLLDNVLYMYCVECVCVFTCMFVYSTLTVLQFFLVAGKHWKLYRQTRLDSLLQTSASPLEPSSEYHRNSQLTVVLC